VKVCWSVARPRAGLNRKGLRLLSPRLSATQSCFLHFAPGSNAIALNISALSVFDSRAPVPETSTPDRAPSTHAPRTVPFTTIWRQSSSDRKTRRARGHLTE
jgi:hypothetical protein